MDHLRAGQSMFVSMLLGGTVDYTGKDISAAHGQPRRMGMNESHFETSLHHFRTALEEVGVHGDRLEHILKLLDKSREAVLNR